jgi:hypothetical protein
VQAISEQIVCISSYSTLKMEAVRSSEVSVEQGREAPTSFHISHFFHTPYKLSGENMRHEALKSKQFAVKLT